MKATRLRPESISVPVRCPRKDGKGKAIDTGHIPGQIDGAHSRRNRCITKAVSEYDRCILPLPLHIPIVNHLVAVASCSRFCRADTSLIGYILCFPVLGPDANTAKDTSTHDSP